MIKLNIHSIVSRITNSSTVIYTYQNSVDEARELLQEILNLSGSDKKSDDLFYFGVFAEDNNIYTDYLDENEDEKPKDYSDDYKKQNKYIENLKEKIMTGDIQKPGWMEDLETNDDGFAPGLSLHIIQKDEKYKPLIDKMIKFLNSPGHDGGRDG